MEEYTNKLIDNGGMIEKEIPIPKLGSMGTIGSAAWTVITTGKNICHIMSTEYPEGILEKERC